MLLNEYIEQVRCHIKEYLPEEFQDAELILQEQRKNNNKLLHGMSLKSPDRNICPLIYLDEYYEFHQSGMAMEDTFRLISKNYLLALDNVKFQKDMNFSYDHMKDKLFLCVVNAEKNQMMLDSVPHQRIEDLAVLHRCLIHSSNHHSGSILVNSKLMDEWGISEETLHEQALRNMDRLFTPEFHPIEYNISKMMGIPYHETEAAWRASDMFVLTNNQGYYGASYLCCPDVLKWVSERMGGDFLLLPSSVDEIIILRQKDDMDISELQEIVESVNQTAVGDMEYLSDSVYRYNNRDQELSIIEGNDMQQGMKLL